MSLNLFELIEYVKNRKIICFGSGIQGKRMAQYFENWNLSENLIGYIDNDLTKVGSNIKCSKCEYPIISFERALDLVDEKTTVLITSLYFSQIYKQIKENVKSCSWDCVAIDEVADQQLIVSDYNNVVKESSTILIPKKIHYAWLGKEMPDQIKRNVEKWKKMCPDYEFFEWNEKNYDISTNNYMKQAYDNQMWGFVPDYMRLDIIYKYGGIYLDTDIEMIKKPDELLYQKCFASVDASFTMNLGSGFGAEPGCEIIKELRDYYDDVTFVREDGTLDKTSCNTHSYNVLKKHGVKINDTLQNIKGMNIYPMVFQGACQYTKTKRVTEKTFWVHYGNMSWMKI